MSQETAAKVLATVELLEAQLAEANRRNDNQVKIINDLMAELDKKRGGVHTQQAKPRPRLYEDGVHTQQHQIKPRPSLELKPRPRLD